MRGLGLMILTMAAVHAAGEDAKMLKFEKIKIGDTIFEAAAVFDVNNDGVPDIVSGGAWYQGPDYKTKHIIANLEKVGDTDYYDDFSDYPMDVNGDGYMDIITGGWWGETLRWRENPKGQPGEWKTHDIAKVGSIERACFFDIDGDGEVEIIPNCPSQPVKIFKLVKDAQGRGTGEFKEYQISEGAQGHGLGFGDINGNGRPDILLAGGWLEAPENPLGGEKWAWHPEFNLASASVPILVHDVNGDGLNDIIVGQAHDYGLDWFEQKMENGERKWIKHSIDPDRSQYHDMQLVDIDNDGELELVTGKRYRAHCGHDPGEYDPIGAYYLKINKGEFKRHTIDYGPADKASGVGIYFWMSDIDGNGWKDIVAPGKDGLVLFRNLGPQ